jgi:ubiquinone/menaquinone biosynthesis C-methylase UbiE
MKQMSQTGFNVENQYRSDQNLNARLYLHQTFSTNKQGWTKWIYQNYNFPKHSVILELGSGNGMLWKDNIELIPEDCQIILTDLSEGMLSAARNNLMERSDIKYEIINAEEIPYPNNSFDAVIANHMLYHVPDRARALCEIKRVLKPTGIFYASTFGQDNMLELELLLKTFDPAFNFNGKEMADRFGLENGKAQLIKHFADVTVRYYEDGLRITQARPLYDYILSLAGISHAADIPENRKEEFLRYLSDIIEKDGAINIRKSAGVFIAR